MTQDAVPITITSHDGLALSALLIPGTPGAPGVVVLHGAGSRKENHLDFAARVSDAGMWGLVPDLRGHGETGGVVDAGMPGDVTACLDDLHLRGAGSLGLRGSSMGGFLALVAAATHPAVGAVAAICPARPESLARLLEAPWPLAHPLAPITSVDDGIARGFWHAMGDEVVPWQDSFALHSHACQPKSLRVAMGGHHRSLQHDPEAQSQTVAFLMDHLT